VAREGLVNEYQLMSRLVDFEDNLMPCTIMF